MRKSKRQNEVLYQYSVVGGVGFWLVGCFFCHFFPLKTMVAR